MDSCGRGLSGDEWRQRRGWGHAGPWRGRWAGTICPVWAFTTAYPLVVGPESGYAVPNCWKTSCLHEKYRFNETLGLAVRR